MNPTDSKLSIEMVTERFMYDSYSGRITSRRTGDPVGNIQVYKGKYKYKRVKIGSQKVMYHRLAWAVHFGRWPKGEIDHISGNTMDNRICNLREVSCYDNKKNKSIYSNNKSGYPGVFYKKGRWYANISIDGKKVYLGGYSSKKEAISARVKAESDFGFHENHGKRRMVSAQPSKGAR